MKAWPQVDWHTEQAEQPYVLAESGEAVMRMGDGAALVGRIAERRFESRVGYLRVYAPMLRVLRLVDVVGDAASIVRDVLHDVDVATTPALPVDSVEYRSLLPLNGDPFTPTWERRLLVLPESWDAFLASRTRKIRAGIRYDMKRLEQSLDARVHVVREWSDELVDTLESIAQTTYQRQVGAGFSRERADVLRVAFEHGWARIYLLADGERPVAFWWCGVHRGTVRLNTTGYLPEHARHRPGIYLLMHVIQDAIADPSLRVLDFGPGRSDYKRHFSNESYLERNLVLYGSTFRAQRARIVRTAVGAATYGARRALDATGATQRIKTAWRKRLRA